MSNVEGAEPVHRIPSGILRDRNISSATSVINVSNSPKPANQGDHRLFRFHSHDESKSANDLFFIGSPQRCWPATDWVTAQAAG